MPSPIPAIAAGIGAPEAVLRLDDYKTRVALFGLAWVTAAVASIALRVEAGGLPLLWLPSALSVAALYRAPAKERFLYLIVILAGGALVNYCFGSSLIPALGYTVAGAVEPLFVVLVADKVMGRRHFDALNLRELVTLFLGAVAGASLGSAFAYPFQMERGVVLLGWWIFASSRGTTVGAPLLIACADWLRRQEGDWRRALRNLPVVFLLAQAGLFAISLWVVRWPYFSLTQLVLAALVFSVVRYGQMGASAGVLMFGIAGTIQSLGKNSPAAYLHFGQLETAVILQSFMLLMLATSLPLAALLMRHDRLSLRLKARNARMRKNLLMLEMAEEIGRIGRWRYDPRSGAQDWSRQMYLINGLNPTRGKDPGDVKNLLPDGGEELFGNLAHHSRDRARYSFEYRIRPPHGEERILKMYATNEFMPDGQLSGMFGVVMDVTEHHQRQEALDKERTRAMRLAAEAQFLAHTDSLTGLANRRRTITQLEKCIRRCEQAHLPLGVISFDIDHFKRINDSNGHQTGDDVLIRIAEIARAQARASDLIGRMGGEEFVWLLPEAGPGETRNAAERLRQAIEQESCEGGLPPVTASVGYAMWREGDDAGHLLARVDAALYAAKQAGRNTVKKAA